MPDVELV